MIDWSDRPKYQRVCLKCRVTSTHACLCQEWVLVVPEDTTVTDLASYAAAWDAVKLEPGEYPIRLTTIYGYAPSTPPMYDYQFDPYLARCEVPGVVTSSWNSEGIGDDAPFRWETYVSQLVDGAWHPAGRIGRRRLTRPVLGRGLHRDGVQAGRVPGP